MTTGSGVLLDAVVRILGRDGIRGLSLSAVADEAGVSRVTLHRHGTTVDQLVVAVLARASDDLRATLWPVLLGSGDAACRLREGLRALCAVADRHAAVLTAFYGQPPRPIPDNPGRTTSFEFIELFERLLRDGESDGSLTVDNAATQAALVANAVCWTYLHMRRAHGWPPGTTADVVVDLATSHLTPRAGPTVR